MQQAAIYVRDPLTIPGSIISKEDQEKACRDYCKARDLTVSATFRDTAGSRDEFTRMISEATRDHSPLDYIVVWKLTASPCLSRRPSSCETSSDELGPDWSRPQKKASTVRQNPTSRRQRH